MKWLLYDTLKYHNLIDSKENEVNNFYNFCFFFGHIIHTTLYGNVISLLCYCLSVCCFFFYFLILNVFFFLSVILRER